MNTPGMVKKQTLYLAVLTALIIGFVGGVAYSVYFSPSARNPQLTAQQQQVAATITALEQAAEKNPKDSGVWVQLGHAYFDTDQPTKAIDAYNKALQLQPGDVGVMTDLGVMYHQEKQDTKAIELFDKVLAINPEHEQARFNKGVVLLTGFGDRKGAIEQWKILVKQHPMAAAPTGAMVSDLIDQLEKPEGQH